MGEEIPAGVTLHRYARVAIDGEYKVEYEDHEGTRRTLVVNTRLESIPVSKIRITQTTCVPLIVLDFYVTGKPFGFGTEGKNFVSSVAREMFVDPASIFIAEPYNGPDVPSASSDMLKSPHENLLRRLFRSNSRPVSGYLHLRGSTVVEHASVLATDCPSDWNVEGKVGRVQPLAFAAADEMGVAFAPAGATISTSKDQPRPIAVFKVGVNGLCPYFPLTVATLAQSATRAIDAPPMGGLSACTAEFPTVLAAATVLVSESTHVSPPVAGKHVCACYVTGGSHLLKPNESGIPMEHVSGEKFYAHVKQDPVLLLFISSTERIDSVSGALVLLLVSGIKELNVPKTYEIPRPQAQPIIQLPMPLPPPVLPALETPTVQAAENEDESPRPFSPDVPPEIPPEKRSDDPNDSIYSEELASNLPDFTKAIVLGCLPKGTPVLKFVIKHDLLNIPGIDPNAPFDIAMDAELVRDASLADDTTKPAVEYAKWLNRRLNAMFMRFEGVKDNDCITAEPSVYHAKNTVVVIVSCAAIDETRKNANGIETRHNCDESKMSPSLRAIASKEDGTPIYHKKYVAHLAVVFDLKESTSTRLICSKGLPSAEIKNFAPLSQADIVSQAKHCLAIDTSESPDTFPFFSLVYECLRSKSEL